MDCKPTLSIPVQCGADMVGLLICHFHESRHFCLYAMPTAEPRLLYIQDLKQTYHNEKKNLNKLLMTAMRNEVCILRMIRILHIVLFK